MARVVPKSSADDDVYLDISVGPQDFIRDRMISLARQLNRDYVDEPRLSAVIFDSERAARNYNPIGAGYEFYKKLERGAYYLDRVKGVEFIHFSTRRGKPADEIKINLGPEPTAGSKKHP